MSKRATRKSQTALNAASKPVIEKESSREDMKRERPKRRVAIIAVTLSVLIFLTIYILRVDRVAGMLLDDAWYVLLAKSLASGQGYRLINSPGAHILPLYPPGFPFLLSFVFRIAPQFPENYWLLKSVSIAAMLGIGLATYFHCRRTRQFPGWSCRCFHF